MLLQGDDHITPCPLSLSAPWYIFLLSSPPPPSLSLTPPSSPFLPHCTSFTPPSPLLPHPPSLHLPHHSSLTTPLSLLLPHHSSLTPSSPLTHPSLTPPSPLPHPSLTPHSPLPHPSLTPHSPLLTCPCHPTPLQPVTVEGMPITQLGCLDQSRLTLCDKDNTLCCSSPLCNTEQIQDAGTSQAENGSKDPYGNSTVCKGSVPSSLYLRLCCNIPCTMTL